MAKDKLKKKKEREKRVAQKKLAADAKRREQEQTEKETKKGAPKTSKVIAPVSVPKPTHVAPTTTRSPFTHRRTGG